MEIERLLEQHLKDDKESFKKLEEIAKQNGEHLSYFNKNLEEVKAMLTDQNKLNLEQQKVITEHINRVEPMLSSYERDTAFNKVLGEKGRKWGVRIGMVASVIGAWYVIKSFVISAFIK